MVKVNVEEFIKMRDEGVTRKELAEHFGIYLGHVDFIIKKFNLPRRRNLPWKKILVKEITFKILAEEFPTRTIQPYGECIVVPECKFSERWRFPLGKKIIFIPGNNACYLICKQK